MSRIEEALNKAAKQAVWRTPLYDKDAECSVALEDTPVDPARFANGRLVVASAPASDEAEQFRKLKEALLAIVHAKEPQNVFLVTSPGQGDGKSLVAVNLAMTLAKEHNHTVLLMDADLRKPCCHTQLGITPKTGLSECLQGGHDIGEAIVATGIGGFSLLPAGAPLANPLELFTSKRMKRLILEMKRRYVDRIILIDAPPVLLFAETRSLNTLADLAILVLREGKNSLEEVREAASVLGNKVAGLVYNGAQRTAPGYCCRTKSDGRG